MSRPSEPDDEDLSWVADDFRYTIGPQGGQLDCKRVDSPPDKWLEERIREYEMRVLSATEELEYLRNVYANKDRPSQ